MSFWDSIKYILGGLTLIVVAVVGLVLAVMPIIYRCKDLLQGNTAKMRAKDKLLLTKFGSIGSIIYVVFDALLAGFFTFLPLYVMGVAWQLSALFAIGTLACKSGMSSDTEREFYLYVVGGVQLLIWIMTVDDVIGGPINALAITYYITAALFVVTMIVPVIVLFIRPYIKRKSK